MAVNENGWKITEPNTIERQVEICFLLDTRGLTIYESDEERQFLGSISSALAERMVAEGYCYHIMKVGDTRWMVDTRAFNPDIKRETETSS